MKKLVFSTTMLVCIFLFLLLKPCTSVNLNSNVHPSLTSLPRKLKAMEKVTTADKHVESQMKAEDEIIGDKAQTENVKVMEIRGERWTEWEEVHDPSDLFTMDYRRVRRRRPIHNKSWRP
ncbi:protein GOLVEN 6-like isoform X2 [Beta vulgaris subsp. vulgaris]|uniref:protein GOLVEN 6-like isoform X2 n=1 Tax=Beta vulgaris subsp. vulgaris TaxID=3555 RepID=UPI0020372DD5|nr:protein GOLVEN 6-like isoform X2 [Beta vulgaris subsp. vulgaris]